MEDKKISISHYALWNALYMCPDVHKTEQIKELERALNPLNNAMGHVTVVISTDESWEDK